MPSALYRKPNRQDIDRDEDAFDPEAQRDPAAIVACQEHLQDLIWSPT
jgi:hypothetical protein